MSRRWQQKQEDERRDREFGAVRWGADASRGERGSRAAKGEGRGEARVKEEEAEEAAAAEEAPKQEPTLALSGKLAEEANRVNGVATKYVEPDDAHAPTGRWRLYAFKDGEVVETLHLHRSSLARFGKDPALNDAMLAHPSCSREHAVIQFRRVDARDRTGAPAKVVRPYVMDLESTNGTRLNGQRIEAARYYELRVKDVLEFGFSSRKYVLINAEEEAEAASGAAQ